MKPVLVDTGFLVSLYDRHDRFHTRCLSVYDTISNPLATCEAVITEALHILRHSPNAVHGILASIENGTLEIPFALGRMAVGVEAILAKYGDLPADFADACLIYLADELDTGDILTIDREFAYYRWRKNRVFRLLIPLD